MKPADLDVITIGRASVDLYGQQVGGRLEDMASFAKAVGGCPSNIAIGTARLGLKSGLDHPGRRRADGPLHPRADAARGRRDARHQDRPRAPDGAGHPRRARREAVSADLLPRQLRRHGARRRRHRRGASSPPPPRSSSPARISARPNTDAAQRKAIRLAKAHGRKVVFDVDYRPNLWGLAGHGAGEERYIKADHVTAHLKTILPDCDLIVGTEEELAIAGGSEDTLETLRRIRAVSTATIVCKRGPMGCVVFPGAIPGALEDGHQGPGLPGRGLQRARRGRCLHVRLPARLAEGRAAGDGLRLRQCLRRLRRLAPALLAGKPDLRGAAATSSSMAARSARCARTPRSTTSTGRRPAVPARSG